MNSSDPRRSARSLRRGGFTLIEVLVVVVIIGIISAVAVIAVGTLGDDRELQTQARRLAALIETASDEATLQGRDFGLELLQGGYRFVEYDPLTGRWSEVLGDDLMRPRTLTEDTEFDLFLEGKRVLLDVKAADTARDDSDSNRDRGKDYLPHVLILSSGDITPFELEINRNTDRRSVALSVAANGELKVDASEDE
jgi:general secretion pathway protein H